MTEVNYELINPAYVQINKKDAAHILGISTAELDRRRNTDEHCPKGFKVSKDRFSPVKFRLSDIYTYSEYLMQQAMAKEEAG